MSFEHLTEEELQELAITAEIPEHAATHLYTCAACSEQLETYRQLFSTIANQPAIEFDFNVTEAVMEKLTRPAAKKTRVGISFIMFLIIVGICTYSAWLFADDLSLLFKNMSWLIPALTFVSLATVAIALGFDMYSRYNKKLNLINSLK